MSHFQELRRLRLRATMHMLLSTLKNNTTRPLTESETDELISRLSFTFGFTRRKAQEYITIALHYINSGWYKDEIQAREDARKTFQEQIDALRETGKNKNEKNQ